MTALAWTLVGFVVGWIGGLIKGAYNSMDPVDEAFQKGYALGRTSGEDGLRHAVRWVESSGDAEEHHADERWN